MISVILSNMGKHSLAVSFPSCVFFLESAATQATCSRVVIPKFTHQVLCKFFSRSDRYRLGARGSRRLYQLADIVALCLSGTVLLSVT